MKKIFGLILVFLMAACSTAEITKTKEVIVVTNVDEAEVYLDGKLYGIIEEGYHVVNVPLDRVHIIKLKTYNDSNQKIIDKNFNEELITLNFRTKKNLKTIKEKEVVTSSKVEKELENLKFKEQMKQELELERTKERLLLLEVQKRAQ